ncbi:unnamed protein product, partial [Brenthis ino]
MYFPDEVVSIKKTLTDSQATDNNSLEDPPQQVVSTAGSTLRGSGTMSDRIYFPDEVVSVKKTLTDSQATDNNSLEVPPEQVNSTEENILVWKSETIVSDNLDGQRIIFPDQLEHIKDRASEIKDIETRIEEDPPEENLGVEVTNMIVAPPNCPKGQQMGADGVCLQYGLPTYEYNQIMADSDSVVFPDEVEETKTKVSEETEATDTNTIEQPPEVKPSITMRNMIVAPSNCPAGQEKDANGICRDVF